MQRINRPNSFDDIQRIETEIAGHPGCCFNALIGGGAAENAVFDAIAAEMVLEASVDKAAFDMLELDGLA